MRAKGAPRRPVAGAIVLAAAVAAFAPGCAIGGATKGSDEMIGTLMKIIPESNAVAFVRLGQAAKTTVQGRPWVKVPSAVIESFRGLKPGATSVDLLVPESSAAGLRPGEEAVVFLKSEGAGYRLVKFSEPLEVPKEGREAFLRIVRETVSAAQPMSGTTMRRQNILKNLQSGIDFFQMDASRSALDATGWTEPEIEVLITLVKGDETHKPVEGLTRDNLIAVAARWAAVPRAISFGKDLLKGGEYRSFYLGLAERKPPESETIVKGCLADPEEKIQVNALLVAGLLRRQDLLDAFAAGYKRPIPPAIQAALKQAREFVTREI